MGEESEMLEASVGWGEPGIFYVTPPSGDSAQPYDFRALACICVYRHIGTDPWLERHLMFNTVSHRWLYR